MNYTWLLEERLGDNDFINIASALAKRDIPYKTFNGLFGGFSTHSENLDSLDPFIFQGTISGALIVRNMPNCLLQFTPRNYACTSYYPFLFSHLLNYDYRIYQMLQTPLIAADYDKEERFVRPDSALKNFVGKVISNEEVRSLRDSCSYYDNTDLIIVASPKDIMREWRLLFHTEPHEHGSIVKYITGSQYRDSHGDHIESIDVPGDLIKMTTNLLNSCQYFPDPLFYCDMAETKDGFKVAELSAFMCAGLYKCDVNRIIDAISLTKLS